MREDEADYVLNGEQLAGEDNGHEDVLRQFNAIDLSQHTNTATFCLSDHINR